MPLPIAIVQAPERKNRDVKADFFEVVRSEDVKYLLPISRLRKGAGETASLTRNDYFERFPHHQLATVSNVLGACSIPMRSPKSRPVRSGLSPPAVAAALHTELR